LQLGDGVSREILRGWYEQTYKHRKSKHRKSHAAREHSDSFG
jgi:putative SOS response-associated peptidase YedK